MDPESKFYRAVSMLHQLTQSSEDKDKYFHVIATVNSKTRVYPSVPKLYPDSFDLDEYLSCNDLDTLPAQVIQDMVRLVDLYNHDKYELETEWNNLYQVLSERLQQIGLTTIDDGLGNPQYSNLANAFIAALNENYCLLLRALKTMVHTKKHIKFSELARRILHRWWNDHISNPYPTPEEKKALSVESHLTVQQVSSWFDNKRNRTKKPLQADDQQQRLIQLDLTSIEEFFKNLVDNPPSMAEVEALFRLLPN